jgi:hypothetical protein
MRARLTAATSALIFACTLAAASAQCDDKSQQNAADEAAVKGDLAAGSKCADASDKARSEMENEDAAVRAKRASDPKSGTVERDKDGR